MRDITIEPNGKFRRVLTAKALELHHKLTDSEEELPCSMDPELWYSTDPVEILEAKQWCRKCPLLTTCFTYALEAREGFGVWGGATAHERYLLRRRLAERRK